MSKSLTPFRSQPFHVRAKESQRVFETYPDKIPVIVERDIAKNSNVPEIDKHKFLVPRDFEVSRFLIVLRNRIKLTSEQALFLFINGTIPPNSALISDLYAQHKDQDGFLYITYTGEATFGSL